MRGMSTASELLRRSSLKPHGAEDGPDLREVWFSLMRFRWSTLGIVPAHAGGDALAVARGLVELGAELHGRTVTLMQADKLDLGGAAQIVERV